MLASFSAFVPIPVDSAQATIEISAGGGANAVLGSAMPDIGKDTGIFGDQYPLSTRLAYTIAVPPTASLSDQAMIPAKADRDIENDGPEIPPGTGFTTVAGANQICKPGGK